jgi:hypothetical protein
MDRYDGKPLLRLLELYVLDVLGELSEDQIDNLRQIEPKLRETYGVNGSWVEIIGSVMAFPPSLPGDIRDVWRNGLIEATRQSINVDPEEFARHFADMNFDKN